MRASDIVPSTIVNWAAAVLAGLAVTYLLSKSAFLTDPAVDFSYIWVAGVLWNDGVSPYSDAFAAAGPRLFPGSVAPPDNWFYPPSWWAISSGLALMPYDWALWVWRTVGAALLCGGVLAVMLGLRAAGRAPAGLTASLTLAWACLFSGTAVGLWLGQTALLSFFGVCLFIHALLSGHRGALVVALVVLMLKPQVGLPFCAFLIAFPRHWVPLLIAGVLSLALAVPSLQQTGIMPFLSAYAELLDRHGQILPNHPLEITGLRIVAWTIADYDVPPLLLTGAGTLVGLGLGLLVAFRGIALAPALAALLALLALVMPLHYYDLTLLAPVILLVAVRPTLAYGLIVAGLLLLLRANNIADATGLYDPATNFNKGTAVGTVAILVLTVGVLMTLRADPIAQPSAATRPMGRAA